MKASSQVTSDKIQLTIVEEIENAFALLPVLVVLVLVVVVLVLATNAAAAKR